MSDFPSMAETLMIGFAGDEPDIDENTVMIVAALGVMHEGNRMIYNALVDLRTAIEESDEKRADGMREIMGNTFSVVR